MDRVLIYGSVAYVVIIIIGAVFGALIPALIIGALLLGLVAGYKSSKDVGYITVRVMVIAEVGGLLLYPNILLVIGMIALLCLTGATGTLISHRLKAYPVPSQPQPSE